VTHHPDGGPPRHAVRGSTTLRMPGPIVRALLESTRWVARVAAWGGTPLDVNPSPWVGRLRGGVGAGAALLALHLEAVLRPPLTFTERVRHRMSRDRRHLLRTLTDKLAAREHVASLVGEGRQARLLAVAASTSELDRSALPREHVIKVSHGSGGTIVIAEDAPRGAIIPDARTLRNWPRLRLHPDDADPDLVDAVLDRLLGWDYAWRPTKPLVHQWAYRDLPRRILVEELLRDADGRIADDLKLFTVAGEVQLITVEQVGVDGVRRTRAMTPDWARPPGAEPREEPARPVNLAAAIELAQHLGRGIDMVRVDLYDLGDRVVVGELTVYPMGGYTTRPAGHFGHGICPGWDPTREPRARHGDPRRIERRALA
jgi:hypothetical protein